MKKKAQEKKARSKSKKKSQKQAIEEVKETPNRFFDSDGMPEVRATSSAKEIERKNKLTKKEGNVEETTGQVEDTKSLNDNEEFNLNITNSLVPMVKPEDPLQPTQDILSDELLRAVSEPMKP